MEATRQVNYFPDKSVDENERVHKMLEEVIDHLEYVLLSKFKMGALVNPEHAVGRGHVVIRFQSGSERWVFRSPLHSREQLRRNLLAYRHVGLMKLMPEKVYHDGKCLIEKYVEGHPLSSAASDASIIDLAHKLSRMHAIPATHYGPLDFDLQGRYESAVAYFSRKPPIAVDRSDADLNESQERLLNAAVKRAAVMHPDLMNSGVFLGHGDLWRKNILVSSEGVRVIDWDRIGAYPPEYDLVFIAEAELTSQQQFLFLRHYGRPVNTSLLSWFNLRRTLLNGGLRLEKKVARLQHLELV